MDKKPAPLAEAIIIIALGYALAGGVIGSLITEAYVCPAYQTAQHDSREDG